MPFKSIQLSYWGSPRIESGVNKFNWEARICWYPSAPHPQFQNIWSWVQDCPQNLGQKVPSGQNLSRRAFQERYHVHKPYLGQPEWPLQLDPHLYHDIQPQRSWRTERKPEGAVVWLLRTKQVHFCSTKSNGLHYLRMESSDLRPSLDRMSAQVLCCPEMPSGRAVFHPPRAGSTAPAWTGSMNTAHPGDLCRQLLMCLHQQPLRSGRKCLSAKNTVDVPGEMRAFRKTQSWLPIHNSASAHEWGVRHDDLTMA